MQKISLYMVRTCLLMLLIMIVIPVTVWSQNTVTLNLRNVRMQEIFNTIERETGYRFFYNNDEVNVNRKVSINVSGKSVSETLETVFRNLPYTFREVENKLIVIEVDRNQKAGTINRGNYWQRISGYVVDDKIKPLPGVTVLVKGTNTGTVTGQEGDFSLMLPSGAGDLVFSFVGMRTQEVRLTGDSVYYIQLSEEAIGLNEIVVIGYGSLKKADVTGSVAIVSVNDLTRTPTGDFAKALQGRAPGLLITQTGVPGGNAQIRIRGVGSISSDPNPIYVIDGIITGSQSLSSLNPDDIESIQVLKDASAAAIYGADGANGVIIVTTKRGEKGTSRISYSGFFSVNRVPREFEMMDASEYSGFYKSLLEQNNITVPLAYSDHFREWYFGPDWQDGTNWQDQVTRTAFGQNHNLRVSGGGETSNYSVSLNYYNETGILLSTAADRYNMRANSDFRIGKFMRFGETFSVTRFVSQNPSTWEGNPWEMSLLSSPLMRVYNSNNAGGYEGPQIAYFYSSPDGSQEIVSNTGFNDKVNPRAPLEIGDYKTYGNNVLASIYLEVFPVRWLTFKTMPSVEGSFNRIRNWFPSFDLGVRSNGQAQLFENMQEMITMSLENQVTCSGAFRGHNFTATAVHHVRKSDTNFIDVRAEGFPYEQLSVISQSYESGRQVFGEYIPFASESYLGRLIYDYKSKYLFTASLRYDGNSRFGPENRWGTFPSFSAGWKINEDFFAADETVNLLKLRAGWGKTGNSNIGNFQYMSLLDGFSQFSPVFGVNQKVVPALNVVHSFGNPFIKWEAAETWNFGIDANLFNNSLQINAEYYIKNQNDLLVKIPLTSAYGRVSGRGDPWVNLGELQNKGFEFSGTYNKVSGLFNYSIRGNFTTIDNKVKYIPGEILTDNNLTTSGYAIGSFYGYVAERIITPADFSETGEYLHAMPSTGVPQPGDLKFANLNNDGIINEQDRTIIGKAIPDFTYSLNFEAFYRNFDLSVFFLGMHNFSIYNHLRASIEGFTSQDLGHNKLRDYAMNYYRSDRPSEKYIRADINNSNQNDRPSTWYLEDGSFFRMKNIQLGYTFRLRNENYLGLTRLRLYASASNLFIITGYSGRDPESPMVGSPLEPGNDDGVYPVPRSFIGGIQIDF